MTIAISAHVDAIAPVGADGNAGNPARLGVGVLPIADEVARFGVSGTEQQQERQKVKGAKHEKAYVGGQYTIISQGRPP
jgi:hypothetical protein